MVGAMMQIAWYNIPKNLEHLFYALDPLVTGILLTNMTQWCYNTASLNRSGPHWQKWRPVYMVAGATFLCMLQPMAVLLIYVGEIGYPGARLWQGSEWFPNTPHGIALYSAKWVGMGFMLTGVLQITQLHRKILERWRQIREGDEDSECDEEVNTSTESREFVNGKLVIKVGTREVKRSSCCSSSSADALADSQIDWDGAFRRTSLRS